MLERSLELSSEELIEANSGLRAIFEALPDLFIRMDNNGKILELKSGNEKDLFNTSVSLIGKNIQDSPIEGINLKFNEALAKIKSEKCLTTIEYSINNHKLTSFYEARLKPFTDDQIIVLIRNITDRKNIEESLRNIALNAYNVQSSDYFENMAVYVSKMLNVKYSMIAELDTNDKNIAHIIALCSDGDLLDKFTMRLENTPCGGVLDCSIKIIKINASRIYPEDEILKKMKIESYIGIPLKDSTGVPIGIIAIMDTQPLYKTDVAESLIRIFGARVSSELERKKNEQELIAAKENAEKSDRLKSEFLAQISLEIRTPVNTILSFSSLIKEQIEQVVDKEILSSFDIINSGGKRLIRTIDLVLNMADLQTGSYQPNPTKLSLRDDILLPLIQELKYNAEQKGLTLQIKHSNKADQKLTVDRYTVTQIFANLIDNGIKYTRKGGVRIKIIKPDTEKLRVKVIDTGIGMSKEFLPIIFNTFTQEDSGYTRKFEGNGLGLALVKKYCEINNIEISVSSRKKLGTIFTLDFPIRQD